MTLNYLSNSLMFSEKTLYELKENRGASKVFDYDRGATKIFSGHDLHVFKTHINWWCYSRPKFTLVGMWSSPTGPECPIN